MHVGDVPGRLTPNREGDQPHERPDVTLLSSPVTILDINDAEAFVAACINKSRLILTVQQREDLTAEGLRILWQLHSTYEPGRNGQDAAGSRFSGYAAKFLPGKLSSAWHQMQEHHRLSTREDGKREWVYDQPAVSLDAIAEEDPTDNVRALHVTDQPISDLAVNLRRALREQWQRDEDITVRFGEMLGEDMTPAQACRALGMSSSEARDCIARIQRVSHRLSEAA